MAGAVDALSMGAALFDEDERIISCCKRFAALAGVGQSDLLGRSVPSLVDPADHVSGRWLLGRLWDSGEPFTFLTRYRQPAGAEVLVESFVALLATAEGRQGMILARPFTCRGSVQSAPPEVAKAMAGYAVDMTYQMAEMAAQASLPVMCDLLHVAAEAGLREAGLSAIVPTPA